MFYNLTGILLQLITNGIEESVLTYNPEITCVKTIYIYIYIIFQLCVMSICNIFG